MTTTDEGKRLKLTDVLYEPESSRTSSVDKGNQVIFEDDRMTIRNKSGFLTCKNRGTKMEFTAPHTPQHNGVVERGFVIVRQRALAMMLSAKLTDEYQGLL